MDDISNTLNNCRQGCIVNNVSINHLIYADDKELLAPSAHASGHDIVYNTRKTVCMCVKPKRFKSNIVHEFALAGNNLKHATNHKYLGVQLTTNCKDDTATM